VLRAAPGAVRGGGGRRLEGEVGDGDPDAGGGGARHGGPRRGGGRRRRDEVGGARRWLLRLRKLQAPGERLN
jgi:hypothetical protein